MNEARKSAARLAWLMRAKLLLGGRRMQMRRLMVVTHRLGAANYSVSTMTNLHFSTTLDVSL